jgi:hypothetical protein
MQLYLSKLLFARSHRRIHELLNRNELAYDVHRDAIGDVGQQRCKHVYQKLEKNKYRELDSTTDIK